MACDALLPFPRLQAEVRAESLCAAAMAAKVPTNDTGIATIGMIAGRQPCSHTI